MISKDEQYLRKICAEYEKVENYEEAVADQTQEWHLHHRNGIRISKEELVRLGLYFNRPAGELMFLTKAEHTRLHNVHKRPDTRNKLSESMKGKPGAWKGKHHSEATKKRIAESVKGENNPMYGKRGPMHDKHHSAAAKQKISEAKKGNQNMLGKHHSAAAKQKMSEAKKGKPNGLAGKRWFNNGILNIRAKECPEGFVRGRLRPNK